MRGREWAESWRRSPAEGAALSIAEVQSKGVGDNESKLLEGVFLGGGSCMGVSVEVVGGVFGCFPAGCGEWKEADGTWGGGGAVVHSGCVGVVGLEGGSWEVGGWAEEKGVEHWAPSAVRADSKGNKHHVLVEELAHDYVTFKIIVVCISSTTA